MTTEQVKCHHHESRPVCENPGLEKSEHRICVDCEREFWIKPSGEWRNVGDDTWQPPRTAPAPSEDVPYTLHHHGEWSVCSTEGGKCRTLATTHAQDDASRVVDALNACAALATMQGEIPLYVKDGLEWALDVMQDLASDKDRHPNLKHQDYPSYDALVWLKQHLEFIANTTELQRQNAALVENQRDEGWAWAIVKATKHFQYSYHGRDIMGEGLAWLNNRAKAKGEHLCGHKVSDHENPWCTCFCDACTNDAGYNICWSCLAATAPVQEAGDES